MPVAGPAAAAVVSHRPAHVDREREPVHPASLPGHGQLTVAPIQVVEAEGSNLVGPQPEPGQHRQDREYPRRPPAVRRSQLANKRLTSLGSDARARPLSRHAAPAGTQSANGIVVSPRK